jgi:hypothetical protein
MSSWGNPPSTDPRADLEKPPAVPGGGSEGEPTLDDVRTEFPEWHCWTGVNRLLYARLTSTSPAIVVCGEDAADLRDQIIGARWRQSYSASSRG